MWVGVCILTDQAGGVRRNCKAIKIYANIRFLYVLCSSVWGSCVQSSIKQFKFKIKLNCYYFLRFAKNVIKSLLVF